MKPIYTASLVPLLLCLSQTAYAQDGAPAQAEEAPAFEAAPAPDAVVTPPGTRRRGPETPAQPEQGNDAGADAASDDAAPGDARPQDVAPAQAQAGTFDPQAHANFGEVDLTAGFTPDPNETQVTASGPIDVSTLGHPGCVGFISGAPDLRLNYTSDFYSLYISAESAQDTALVVQTPSGDVVCDDDSGGNLNPLVTIETPESGAYAIWLGSYGAEVHSDATLRISELAPVDEYAGDGYADPSLAAQFGETVLTTGFKPDPFLVPVEAGGGVSSYSPGDVDCVGYVSDAPTYRVHFTAGALPLTFTARSMTDTVLAVRDPYGIWHCNDDSDGTLNPMVTIAMPDNGAYDVFVGTYSGETGVSALLGVSELR